MTQTSAKPFLDTNVLIYAVSSDHERSAKAEALVAAGGTISVQVLNEFAHVARRKLGRTWSDIQEALGAFQTVFSPIVPLSVELHRAAVELARDNNISFYDALIVATALSAKCDVLFSEDFQSGRKFGPLTVCNPFAPEPF